MNNKCPICDYEGEEKVCPQCKMLMQEKCQGCGQSKIGCICILKNKTDKK
jgi:hypothetical protein